ncbi:Penicillin-binding protein 1B, isoform gamma [Candidatus Erwinia haradaeae]|uniref:Penicillin-binding protein 1B n=1 Tax=Candidatus Erwinia haradaeae TaxID=1922217 RepID=A0A451DA39_9GAMM|nr:bifunctional glycosyl transferase/transpeptidase [Candidatus Erwinia haradaeae]VFP83180.1 Penicillin-binding protein 1B, isoform gamma [Candidatus Erwinia haradaeae]
MKNTKKKRVLYNNSMFMIYVIYSACTCICIILVYGYWLDSKIQSRINGKVWKLPATVYSRIITLAPCMPYTKTDIISLLRNIRYRQVTHLMYSGEFTVHAHSIEMIRRPFDFPDKKEGIIHARLIFTKNHLMEIKNLENNHNVGVLRLDPCLITLLHSPHGEQRLFMKRYSFPQPLVNILINTEDRHFYHHSGINFYSIFRAFLVNISAGHTIQGGSTLTQQLVKNLFLTNQRSLWRKANEAYMAIILDARYQKDRILELYLNEVYLGQVGNNQIHGFPLASLYYFGRPVDELSFDQQALLVGMVKGASIYHPWRNPEAVLRRRNLLLRLLKQQNIINEERYLILSARPLGVSLKGGLIPPQPAFIQLVCTELHNNLSHQKQDLSGMKIFTTLDPSSQDAAEKSIKEGMSTLRHKQNIEDLEGAMIVADRLTGEIHAMVGDSNPKCIRYHGILQTPHAIGSLAQTAIYLTAFNTPNTYHFNNWIVDSPLEPPQSNHKIWRPQNNAQVVNDEVMLIDAFINSMHTPTVNLGLKLGLMPIIDTWEKLGAPKKQLQPISSILLGALNLTPLEVTQIFQIISNSGNRVQLTSLCTVISDNGTILYQSLPHITRVITPQSAYLTLYGMQKVVAQGSERELGALYPEANLAGKAGATNHLADNWFAGVDGREVTITWVGHDNNKSDKSYSVYSAMQIYKRYLEKHTPWSLILTLPEDIALMPIDTSGRFICGNDMITSYIPIWTTNRSLLCQNKTKNKQHNQHSITNRLSGILGYFIHKIT